MKSFVFGFAGAALLVAVDIASAADMIVKARHAAKHDPCGVARFSGAYVGGNAGAVAYTAIRHDVDRYSGAPADFSANTFGATAGIQAGYDWQSCNKVFGLVADWNWADTQTATQSLSIDPSIGLSVQSRMDWFSTLRARAGLAVNDTLFYVTGGVAAAKIKSNITAGFPHAVTEHAAFGETRWGLVGGVGAEFALWNNWSVNTELLYMQFEKSSDTFHSPAFSRVTTFESNDSLWVGRIGLNYRWDNPRTSYASANAGGAAPFNPCGPARFNGSYVGGNAGAVSYTALRQDKDRAIASVGDYSAATTGFTAGGQLGWDWQSCNKLLGIVADWNWFDRDATARLSPNQETFDRSTEGSMRWFSTLRARAGLVVDDALIYVTGGFAAAEIESTYTNRVPNFVNEQHRVSDMRWGLAGGVGVEFALQNNWSLNSELLYLQFRKKTDTFYSVAHAILSARDTNVGFENHDSAWVSRVGLNYRWDNPRNAASAQSVASPCGPVRFNGGYIGGNAGAIRHTALGRDQDGYITIGEFTGTKSGVTAGGQAGFDWQSCHKLFGVVADWNWANAGTLVRVDPGRRNEGSIRSDMDWFSTVRARTGLVVDDALLYVTGGLAAARIESTITSVPSKEQFSFGGTRWGWVGGAGAEFALAGNWSVNGELLYMQFAKDTDTFRSISQDQSRSFENYDSAWIGRVGVNYRFGDTGMPAAKN
jgi:opacity protein-like surface antigen